MSMAQSSKNTLPTPKTQEDSHMSKPKIGLLGLMTDGYEPTSPRHTRVSKRTRANSFRSFARGAWTFPARAQPRQHRSESPLLQRTELRRILIVLGLQPGFFCSTRCRITACPSRGGRPARFHGQGRVPKLDLTSIRHPRRADNANMIVAAALPAVLRGEDMTPPRQIRRDFSRAAMTYKKLRA